MFDIAVINSQENKSLSQGHCKDLAGFIGDIAMKKPKGFKDIPGWEKLYAVSKEGIVYSYPNKYGKNPFGMILKQRKDYLGYMEVYLWNNRKRFHRKVHRLVAMTFLLNKENKPFINHKNLIKTDNNINNLEWCTPKENARHYQLNKNMAVSTMPSN